MSKRRHRLEIRVTRDVDLLHLCPRTGHFAFFSSFMLSRVPEGFSRKMPLNYILLQNQQLIVPSNGF